MKCVSCGGALKGAMNFCPYCGVRQDIDLRQLHFRDLSAEGASLPCPECQLPLQLIEVATHPPMKIERCVTCFGMFFNPGELEAVLHQQTEAAVRFDSLMLEQISADFGHRHEVIYRKCPMCFERMSHFNFGGRSGVILDRCGTHGLWLDGGELRRLAEWWRAGGKLIHEKYEAERVGRLFVETKPTRSGRHQVEPEREIDWNSKRTLDPGGGTLADIMELGGILGRIADLILKR